MTEPAAGTVAGETSKAESKRAKRHARHAERRKRKRARAAFWLRSVRSGVRWMPMPMACALGHALGTLGWFLGGRVRRQALEHLAFAMPEKSESERRRIGRRSCALIGRGMLAFVVAHRMGPDRALARLAVTGDEPVRAAIAEGNGVLIVTFHFGCFEMLAAWMGKNLGGRAVGRESDEDGPTAMLIDMRRDLGCDTIQRGEPREILRALRAAKPVAMLIDQDTSDVSGAFVPFFGRLAHTPLGPAALAVRTGAAVVMGFVTWDGLSRHRAFGLPPMYARTDLPAADAALELTARMTAAGEAEIRKRPDHWVWMHRRWNTRPEDHPDYPVFAEVPR